MKIKVCGMKFPDNIRDLASLEPDYIGFIFYGKSKRFVPELSAEVLNSVPAGIKKTGVFVNETAEVITDFVEKFDLQAVQLHGSESPEFCTAIKQTGAEVIKAFGVDDDFDFSQLAPYQNCTDYFLFDTKTKQHGGSGLSFNWRVLRAYTYSKPYFLSGGLGLDNLEQVLEMKDQRLYAADLNSCFETEPALKDIQKLTSAINLLRSPLKETEKL